MKNRYSNKKCTLRLLGLIGLMTIFCGMSGSAQELVKGRVIDASTKQGFAGIRVSIVDTKITTMTSEDGAFELKTPSLSATLQLDAPGYRTQIVPLKGQTELRIQIMEQTNAANFYDETTLSAQKVNIASGATLAMTSIDEIFAARLNGEVRVISHSGITGSGTSLFIRGLNSLNTTAQPLYVVDGVIWQMQESSATIHNGFFNNPLSLIDPNDVENITVLKDATSIYGSKGANGVILIKTRRSQSMATEISVSASLGWHAPFETIPVMDNQAYRLYASDVLSGMYQNSSFINKLKFLEDDQSKSYYKANHNNTDWLSLINKPALSQSYGISVRGGDAVALYSFSIGSENSEGNIENTDFNRLNVRFNSDIHLAEKFKVLFDIAFAQTSNNLRSDGIDDVASPVYLSLVKSPLYSPYQYNRDGSLSGKLSGIDELNVGNPLSIINSGVGTSQKYRFNTIVSPSYSFNEKMKLSMLFSYAWDKLNEESFRPSEGLAALPLVNQYGEIYAYSRNMVKNMMGRQNSIYTDVNVNWTLFRDILHYLNFYGGFRFYSDNYASNYGEGHNTGSDRMNSLANTTSTLRYTTGISDEWRSMSWYLNTDYKYLNRYLLNISATMDASSRFGKNAANALKLGGVSWGVFPSASAGWIISSEDFMKNMSWINFLKLDASYAISGNDNLLNYASRAYFTSIHFMGNAYGTVLDNLRNDALKWETAYKKKVGLDFSLFNDRLSVKADLFDSKTKDLLTRKKLEEIAGIKQYWTNDGELQNKGFEIASNVRILNMRHLNLDIGIMIGHYKNKILSLADGFYISDFQGAQILTSEGLPAGVFYGYKTKGVFSTVKEAGEAKLFIVSESGEKIRFQAGDMHFEEVIKDNIIDEKDRQVIGDPNPDFYGNFNFNLKYKNWTVETLFTYSYGNDAYNALRANLESGSSIYNQATSMQKRWVANGQQSNIPRAAYNDPVGNSRFSDRWIEDASFLKFKTLSVSYKIPFNLPFLQEITVWGAANNLFTLTKYLGADPEFSYGNSVLYQGIDAGLIPSTRSYYLGVKINL